jgi:hypothetical protein
MPLRMVVVTVIHDTHTVTWRVTMDIHTEGTMDIHMST